MNAELSAIGKALAAARAEFHRAPKDRKNDHLKARYASLDAVVEACEPALLAHGLTFTQPIEVTANGPVLKTVLIHTESGQLLESVCPLLFDTNSRINPMQALGSAVSYARRYSLASLVGVLTEDDDAEGAYARQHTQTAQAQPVQRPKRGSQPPTRERQSEQPISDGRQPEETGPRAGRWFLSWCERAAQRIGHDSNTFSLLNHLCRVLSADEQPGFMGYGKLPNLEKAALCEALWRQDVAWQDWFKAQARTYKAELDQKAAAPPAANGTTQG